MSGWAAVLIDGLWRACRFNGEQWNQREMGVRFGDTENGRRCARQFAAGENRKLEKDEDEEPIEPTRRKAYTPRSVFRPIMGGRLNRRPSRFEGLNMEKVPLSCGRMVDLFASGRSRTQIPTTLKVAARSYAIDHQIPLEQALIRLLVDGLCSNGPEEFDRHMNAAEAARIDAETGPYPLVEEVTR